MPPTDPDTCRICRDECSPGNPLFHPCECNGSIKYVHQNCLVGWLSHSQKEHCDICKTFFIFTKLYDPMPKALSASTFFSCTVKHLFRNLAGCLRAALVATVWLGWLPYLIRTIWSYLFLISDEGIGISIELTRRIGLTEQFGVAAVNATSSLPSNSSSHQSLLSEVGFLQNLTRHPSVNRFIIKTLEGQVITVLAIACFNRIIQHRLGILQRQDEANTRIAIPAIEEQAPEAAHPARPGTGDAGEAQPQQDPQAPAEAPLRLGFAGFVGWLVDLPIFPGQLARINFLDDLGDDPTGDANQQNPLFDQAERDIEDAEDMEEILELLGIRGPVAGLFRNAGLYAFLVFATIFLGIFVPYNIGRLAIWVVANPIHFAQSLFSLFELIQDICALVLGFAPSPISQAVHALSRTVMPASAANRTGTFANTSWNMALGVVSRIANGFRTEVPRILFSEVRTSSALCHKALLTIKSYADLAFSALWVVVAFLFGRHYSAKGREILALATNGSALWEGLKALPAATITPSSWVINLSDRFWTVLSGYAVMSLTASLYLHRGTNQAAQNWEASLIDGLNQVSGVVKVNLMISIDWLIMFYCGVLLDVALLPLFKNATLGSRLLFAINYPITSVFVHLFVGRYYVLGLNLFIATCRGIMRKGALHFLRDPANALNDPESDLFYIAVEGNVTAMLRKLLFSGFLYGAVIIVWLGVAVWGLLRSLPDILPIHYSSSEPAFDFTLVLLFCVHIMPLAVKFSRPGDRLYAMFTWWLRRCARTLRITSFLFGERRIDEEGQLMLTADSPDREMPPWRQWFLEVNASGRVGARSWRDILGGGTSQPDPASKSSLVRTGQLVLAGRFVRTPASNQVKTPKGSNVFLEVTENNTRRDGVPDTDIYSTNQYQFVYIPPYFRVRIYLFILFILVFVAVTSVASTITPLVFGRWIFRCLLGYTGTNDIYTFSIGIHVLGIAAYAVFCAQSIYEAHDAGQRVTDVLTRSARIAYTYLFVLVAFPLLVGLLIELYLIRLTVLITGDGGKALAYSTPQASNPVDTIYCVVQLWTIGLLFSTLVNAGPKGGRVSKALRGVFRRGWSDPDASIFTRAFVAPSLVAWLTAVTTPGLLASALVAGGVIEALVGRVHDQAQYEAYVVLVHWASFPVTALVICCAAALWGIVGVLRSWQVRVRDEVYPTRVRLHNLGGTDGANRVVEVASGRGNDT